MKFFDRPTSQKCATSKPARRASVACFELRKRAAFQLDFRTSLRERERVRATDIVPTPEIHEIESINCIRTLRLEALVRMKLNVFRDKDRMHLRDMLDVELIDVSWLERLPTELAIRLKELIDNPEDGLEGMMDWEGDA